MRLVTKYFIGILRDAFGTAGPGVGTAHHRLRPAACDHTTTMSTDEPALDQDVIFDVLSSSRRRYVLYYLSQHDAPVELPTLAEEVAAWETESTVEELSSQERKRVYVSLYQTHVPKLEEVGLVEYDQDTGEVSLTDQSSQIQGFLREPTSARSRLLNLALVVGVSLATLVAGLFALPTVEPSAGLFAVLALWALVTVVVTYLVYRRNGGGEFPRTLRNR